MNVSVVIPTYNREAVVGEALLSVLAQTHKDLQVVVVDDGSTDDTAQRIAAVADDRVVYLRRDNRGVAAARNAGVARSSGELIAFLDSDDGWRPEKLAMDVAFMAAHPEAQAVFSDLEKYDGEEFVPSFVHACPAFSGMLAAAGYPTEMVVPPRAMLLCLYEEVPIMPSAFMIRRDAFLAAGGFDESWRSWEDWEFFMRLAPRGPIGYIDRALTVLRIGSDSLHRTDAERGRRRMLDHFLGQRARCAGDSEALSALARGIVGQCRHLAWHYRIFGRRLAASHICLLGYRWTRSSEMLLKAPAAFLPAVLRDVAAFFRR